MSLSAIKPEDLQNVSQLPFFEQELEEAIRNGKTSDVLDFRLALKKFLEVYADLEYQNANLFSRIRVMKLRIELEFFPLMTDEVQADLLMNHMHDFQIMNMDIDAKAQDLVQLTDPWLYAELREMGLHALLANNEMLGSQQIELDGKLVAPTIGHWVELYRKQDHSSTEAAMARLDFLNHGFARMLSDVDRNLLAQVLEVCDTFATLTPLEEPEEAQSPQSQPQPQNTSAPAKAATRNILYIPEKRSIGTTPTTPTSLPKFNRMPTAPRSIEGMAVPKAEYPVPPQAPTYAPEAVPIVHQQAVPQQAPTPLRPYAATSSTTSPAPGSVFQSLADLEHADRDLVLRSASSFDTFAQGVKQEIEKVYARSPESRAYLVQLWRKSPLYKLYIEMGEQSMDTRTPIQQISEQREQQGLPTLSKEEFDIVADLSRFIQ